MAFGLRKDWLYDFRSNTSGTDIGDVHLYLYEGFNNDLQVRVNFRGTLFGCRVSIDEIAVELLSADNVVIRWYRDQTQHWNGTDYISYLTPTITGADAPKARVSVKLSLRDSRTDYLHRNAFLTTWANL